MALGPKKMGEAILRNLKEKTGKSADEWGDLVEKTKLRDKKEVISFLKTEKGLGHFQAQKVFEHFSGKDHYADPSTFADEIFKSKEAKALYEFSKLKILELAQDIRVQPCRTYIPFYRKNQFALLTQGKDDTLLLGLNLTGNQWGSRFSTKAIKGSERINAQTVIHSTSDFDEDVMSALHAAYTNN